MATGMCKGIVATERGAHTPLVLPPAWMAAGPAPSRPTTTDPGVACQLMQCLFVDHRPLHYVAPSGADQCLQATLQLAYHSFGSPPFAAVLEFRSVAAARQLAADALVQHVAELLATARDRKQQCGSWQTPFLSAAHEAAGRLLLVQVRGWEGTNQSQPCMMSAEWPCPLQVVARQATAG